MADGGGDKDKHHTRWVFLWQADCWNPAAVAAFSPRRSGDIQNKLWQPQFEGGSGIEFDWQTEKKVADKKMGK